MRRLTPDEIVSMSRIAAVGGTYCPDDIRPDRLKMLKGLVKLGYMTAQETDTYPRFELTAEGYAEVDWFET